MRRLLVTLAALVLGLALVEIGLRVYGESWLRRHGRAPAVAAPPGGIACVGDSATFGLYLTPDEAWPMQLEALLDDPALPVLNLALPGAGADRVARDFEAQLERHRPSIAIALCGQNNTWLDAGPLPRAGFLSDLRVVRVAKLVLASFARDGSQVEREPSDGGEYLATDGPLDLLAYRRSARTVPGGRLLRVENRAGERVEFLQPVNALAPAELRDAIVRRVGEIADVARRGGVKLLLLTYPPLGSAFEPANSALREAAMRHGVELLDLDRELRALLDPVERDRKCFPDYHPRAPVCRAIAWRVHAELCRLRWIEADELRAPERDELFPQATPVSRAMHRECDLLVVDGAHGDGLRLLVRAARADPPCTAEELALDPAELERRTGWRELGFHAIGPAGRLELALPRGLDEGAVAVALFVSQSHRGAMIARSELVELAGGER